MANPQNSGLCNYSDSDSDDAGGTHHTKDKNMRKFFANHPTNETILMRRDVVHSKQGHKVPVSILKSSKRKIPPVKENGVDTNLTAPNHEKGSDSCISSNSSVTNNEVNGKTSLRNAASAYSGGEEKNASAISFTLNTPHYPQLNNPLIFKEKVLPDSPVSVFTQTDSTLLESKNFSSLSYDLQQAKKKYAYVAVENLASINLKSEHDWLEMLVGQLKIRDKIILELFKRTNDMRTIGINVEMDVDYLRLKMACADEEIEKLQEQQKVTEQNHINDKSNSEDKKLVVSNEEFISVHKDMPETKEKTRGPETLDINSIPLPELSTLHPNLLEISNPTNILVPQDLPVSENATVESKELIGELLPVEKMDEQSSSLTRQRRASNGSCNSVEMIEPPPKEPKKIETVTLDDKDLQEEVTKNNNVTLEELLKQKKMEILRVHEREEAKKIAKEKIERQKKIMEKIKVLDSEKRKRSLSREKVVSKSKKIDDNDRSPKRRRSPSYESRRSSVSYKKKRSSSSERRKISASKKHRSSSRDRRYRSPSNDRKKSSPSYERKKRSPSYERKKRSPSNDRKKRSPSYERKKKSISNDSKNKMSSSHESSKRSSHKKGTASDSEEDESVRQSRNRKAATSRSRDVSKTKSSGRNDNSRNKRDLSVENKIGKKSKKKEKSSKSTKKKHKKDKKSKKKSLKRSKSKEINKKNKKKYKNKSENSEEDSDSSSDDDQSPTSNPNKDSHSEEMGDTKEVDQDSIKSDEIETNHEKAVIEHANGKDDTSIQRKSKKQTDKNTNDETAETQNKKDVENHKEVISNKNSKPHQVEENDKSSSSSSDNNSSDSSDDESIPKDIAEAKSAPESSKDNSISVCTEESSDCLSSQHQATDNTTEEKSNNEILPGPENFQFLSNFKLYYNSESGYYYDSATRIYFDSKASMYCYYDDVTQEYRYTSKISDAHSNNFALLFHSLKEWNNKSSSKEDVTEYPTATISAEPKLVKEKVDEDSKEIESSSVNSCKSGSQDEKMAEDNTENLTYEELLRQRIKSRLLEKGKSSDQSENADDETETQFKAEYDLHLKHKEMMTGGVDGGEVSPCLRLMLVGYGPFATLPKASSESLPPIIPPNVAKSSKKIESLHVVTVDGATVGRLSKSGVHVPHISVSKEHAAISYLSESSSDHHYYIRDLGSNNGTYVNGKRLSSTKTQSQNVEIGHNWLVNIGEIQFQVHLHPGNSTCNNCEPGLMSATTDNSNEGENVPNEKQRRNTEKVIRKKYGLGSHGVDNSSSDFVSVSGSYSDRAGGRRLEKGSDNPYEKTQVASVHESLHTSNKGYKLLQKMGWEEGSGIGKTTEGIKDPLLMESRAPGAGLGASTHHVPPSSGARDKINKITQRRYRHGR